MQLFKRRPLALFCFIFVLVCAALLYFIYEFESRIGYLPAILLSLAIISLAVPLALLALRYVLPIGYVKMRPILYSVGIGASVIAACAVIFFSVYSPYMKTRGLLDANEHAIEATVTSVTNVTSYSTSAEAKLVYADGNDAGKVKILLTCSEPGAFKVGENISADAVFSTLSDNMSADSVSYYRSRSVTMCAEIKGAFDISSDRANAAGRIDNARSALAERVRPLVEEDTFAFFEAVVLADRSDLPDELSRDFRTLGISHMLAVSGLHLAVLLGALEFIMNLFTLPFSIRAAIRIPFAIIYMALCGFSSSIVRSGVMFIIMMIASLIGEDYDPPTALFFSAALICAFSPASLYDTGFLLSFSATLGLVTFGARISFALESRLTPLLRLLIMSIAVSVCAIMMTLPVVSLRFGYISLAGPIANLAAAPLLSLFLYASLFALSLSSVPNLSSFCGFILDKTYKAIAYLCTYAQKHHSCTVSLSHPAAKAAVIVIFIAIIAVLLLKIRRKALHFLPIAMSAALMICLAAAPTPTDNIAVYHTNGTNDSFILESQGKCAIIDISNGGSKGAFNCAYYSSDELCETNVDAYILTHLHQNHVSTFRRLAGRYYLSYLIIPEPVTESDRSVSSSLKALCERSGVEMLIYPHDDERSKVAFADCEIEFSPYCSLKRSTHPLVSFKISSPERSVCYLGASLFEREGFAADIADSYVFGAHGPIFKEIYEFIPSSADALMIVSPGAADAYSFNKDTETLEDGAFIKIELDRK